MNGIEQQLRDIHIPDIPSIWPLSSAAYFILAFIVSLFIIICIIFLMKWIKGRARRAALKQIEKYQENEKIDSKDIMNISILLKRVALAYFPRKDVAGLVGDDWIEFLARTSYDPSFSKEIASVLLTAPYEKNANTDAKELLILVEKWIKARR